MNDEDFFSSTLAPILAALREHLDKVVLIGGWVPELHRRFGASGEWRVRPLRTIELDVLVEPSKSSPPLATALETAGFKPLSEAPSAVWEREVSTGERIEFFVEHDGPWEGLSTVQPIEEGSPLGGLPLPDLGVLREKAVRLLVPLGSEGTRQAAAEVRVPELGAFLVQKGATFRRRPDPAKQVKDLHYIVDVMQSGEATVEIVEEQIASYCEEGARAAELARQARNQIGLVANARPGALLTRLGRAVAERHGLTEAEGTARAEGFLTDFMELVPSGCADNSIS